MTPKYGGNTSEKIKGAIADVLITILAGFALIGIITTFNPGYWKDFCTNSTQPVAKGE